MSLKDPDICKCHACTTARLFAKLVCEYRKYGEIKEPVKNREIAVNTVKVIIDVLCSMSSNFKEPEVFLWIRQRMRESDVLAADLMSRVISIKPELVLPDNVLKALNSMDN